MVEKRGRGWLFVVAIAVMLGMFATDVRAYDPDKAVVTFHGYAETNLVMRDENGVQYGFLDHLNAVQQRNTLKFDVDVDPKLQWGNFGIAKFHLTYRGAYDSIYDLRANKFGDIPEKRGESRFDYGLKDVKFENDLREGFIDFTYNGALGSAFLRPGKQLVSWGEGSTYTFMDVINPADQSYQLFFQNPDDVKIPIWMVRLNYGLPPMKDVAVNFDFLWVPEIRPSQFGPLDQGGMRAPYVSILPFSALRPFNVLEAPPTEKQEYGAKVTVDVGLLSVSATYYRDSNNDPGVVLSGFTPGSPAYMTHPMQNVYGLYFSYNFAPWDLVIRGDYARQTDVPISMRSGQFDPHALGNATFLLKPVERYGIYLDKKIMVPFITTHERTSFGLEWNHQTIHEWDNRLNAVNDPSKKAPREDIFAGTIGWSWYEGRIAPMIIWKYNPGTPSHGGGSGMIQPRVTWTINSNTYVAVMMQAFLGDKRANSGYAGLVETSELTLKLGYQW